ncbi:MAG: glycosyltransferase family 4 protein [Candidatus Izemoplasma sp.]|nr:glycosyltransferase family 4 protein [Candidatus Izemoplasma sp.]
MIENDVVVVHPIQQHSHLLANVLYKHDRLSCLYTTMYFDENTFLYKLLNAVLPKKYKYKLSSKMNLPFDKKVKSYYTILGLIFIGLGKTHIPKRFLNVYREWLTKIFSKKVARDIRKNTNIKYIISFDTYSYFLYKYLINSNLIKILDMSSIPINVINKIISFEIQKNYNFTKDLKRTKKSFTKKMSDRSLHEIKMSDRFLVASTFTQKSLTETFENAISKKISIAPYFIDSRFFNMRESHNIADKVNFLFVGRLTAVKGFHYLLEAIKKLHSSAEFKFVGHIQLSKEYIDSLPANIKYLGVIDKSQMCNIYSTSNVLIFPSLFDGFGQAIIEAMASSMPVIVTKNSGASDYVTDEENGFIIEPGNIESLVEKIQWMIDNKDKIDSMGKNSYKIAIEFTEKNYYKKVAEIIGFEGEQDEN